MVCTYGGFHQWGHPKMDGLQGKFPLKWMIWGSLFGNHHIISKQIEKSLEKPHPSRRSLRSCPAAAMPRRPALVPAGAPVAPPASGRNDGARSVAQLWEKCGKLRENTEN